MNPGMRVTVNGRPGVVKALRPGNSVDVQFEGDPFTTRHDANHVVALRSNPGVKFKPVFVAAVLDDLAKQQVYDYWLSQDGAPRPLPVPKMSHMTIKFRPSPEEVAAMPIGQPVQLRLVGWASNDQIQAVAVQPIGVGSANATPHVTFALADASVAPKLSNDLFAGTATRGMSAPGPTITAMLGWSDGGTYHFSIPGAAANPGPRGGLTPSEREALPEASFALSGRRFPINDRRHAVIAMQYILRGFVGEGDAPLVLQAIHKKYPPSDRRNAEIWAFFEKHREKLLQQKAPRAPKKVRTAANPQQDVYNIFKEHLRAQVQGVYESQVRSALGLPSGTPFKDARGRRLDESLDAEEKRELFTSAQAITTRQQQKHGYLVPGTQDPTQKGINRALERLSDPARAEENRQDYERTLAALRKSGHFRVVAEVVKGQKVFVVQPKPPAELIQIPAYRLSEEKAREDANRAEVAFQRAPAALKALANPYFTTAYGSTTKKFDFDDTPQTTTVKKGDTLASIAKRMGVVPVEALVQYGRLETKDASGNWAVQPAVRWLQEVKRDGSLYTPPEARSADPLYWNYSLNEPIDESLAGARVRKDVLVAEFERQHGGAAFRYGTKPERDTDEPNVATRRQQTLREEAAVREAEAKEIEILRALEAAEREAASSPKIVQLGNKPPADMTAAEIRQELDQIHRMPGWGAYVRQQEHSENVSKTVATVKGGKAVYEGAQRALNEAIALIGGGVIGYGADGDQKARIGGIVVSREAALSLELRADRFRTASSTSTGNAYTLAGLSVSDAGKKYREDAAVVRQTNISLAKSGVDRFKRQGALAEAYEASQDRSVGIQLGRALKGREGLALSEGEALRQAAYSFDLYKQDKAALERYEQAKARMDTVSAADSIKYNQAPGPERASSEAQKAQRIRELQAQLEELELQEEAAYETATSVLRSDRAREMVNRYFVNTAPLLPYGRELVGEEATDAEAIAAASAKIKSYRAADSVLRTLASIRQELGLDATSKPRLRILAEMKQAELDRAREIVATVGPIRRRLQKAAETLLEGVDRSLLSAAQITPGYKEPLGRKLLGETARTPAAERHSLEEAVAVADALLAKYAETQGRLDALKTAEALLAGQTAAPAAPTAAAPGTQAAPSAPVVELPKAILDLEREGASEKSVLAGLELKTPGSGEMYRELAAGVASIAELQQKAAEATPEVQAATAAAIEEHIRRNVNGPNLMAEVISRLAPGRVIVVYVDQKSKYNPTTYSLPAAYVVPALYTSEDAQKADGSFMRAAVWNTLLAKADAKLGDHIAVYENYDQAVATVKSRIERLAARGTPRTLQLSKLYQAMLDASPSVLLSLQAQHQQYLRDTGQAPPSRFRSGPSQGYMMPGTARGAAREASGAGVDVQREIMRSVVGSLEAERALSAERALALKGVARPSLESFFEAEQQAKTRVVTRLESEGRSLDAVDAARKYIASGRLRLNEFLNTNFRSEATRAKRRQDVSEASLNTLRERLLGPRKPRAMTPSERKQRQLPGAEVPTRAFYDIEFVFDPKTMAPEVRYVMYVPRVLQYIQKTEQALGGVVLAEPESYVRFKQGSPERGPLASAAPPPDTYQKVNQEIADARDELAEAKSKGGPMTVVRALKKLKQAINRERRYKRALIGANTPYSIVGTEVIRGGKKVALFTDPTGGVASTPQQIAAVEKEQKREDAMVDEDDYFAAMEGLEEEYGPGQQKTEAEMRQERIYAQSQAELEAANDSMGAESFTKKIVTPKEAWLEDKSFIAELARSSSYDPASGRFSVADDRKKYAKYYTTNTTLAYYTIMLWNTPELFNGAVVFLPVAIKDDEGNYFDVISTSDVFTDNPEKDPYKVYNDLLQYEILLRSQFLTKLINAKTQEDVEDAARLYVALYGAPQTDREPRQVGYSEAVTRIVRGLEPLDSAKAVFGLWGYERKRRDALQLLLDKERAAMTVLSFPDLPEAKREEIKQRLEQLQAAREKLTQISTFLNFNETPLGRMFVEGKIEALAYGEKDSPEILAAWRAGARDIRKALVQRKEEMQAELSAAAGLPESERRLLAQAFDTGRDTLEFFDRLTAGEAQFVKKNRGA